jgi:predicted nucleic acid-binding protein
VQVLVDTSIWSLALRRHRVRLSAAESERIASLHELVQDGLARLVGPIRQELLSGIREPRQFERLRDQLRAFPDEALSPNDFEQAAHWSNECRRRGIVGSAVDFLICSVAINRGWQVFTTDSGFRAYAKIVPIRLAFRLERYRLNALLDVDLEHSV